MSINFPRFAMRRLHILGATLLAVLALQTAEAGASSSLAQLAASGARVATDPQTGIARFVGYDTSAVADQPAAPAFRRMSAEAAAAEHVKNHADIFGLSDVSTELQPTKHKVRDGGRTMTRYQQHYQGLPVIGGELIVNQTAQNRLTSIGGKISPNLRLETLPAIAAEQASAIALKAMTKWYRLAPDEFEATKPTLSIYDSRLISPHADPVALVWQMEITAQKDLPIREFIAIDARRGLIVLHFNQVPHARDRLTYDAANNAATALPGALVCNEANPTCSGATTDAVYAHKYAGNTYDYYWSTFGRDGIDGAGMTMISTVRYCEAGSNCPYANAFWNGQQMVYGQGYAVGEDVVAHELTHGVTEHESHLFYYYQAGAINESLSDIFGEFVQQSDSTGTVTPATKWLLGEDLSIGAIRKLSDPTAFGDPDKMTSSNYATAIGDRGGVHTNSGVSNKAAFLMTDGGTFNGKTMTGLGKTKVAKIFYEAQTNLLTSGSDFLDLYNALYQACQNLVGTSGIVSSDCQQVRNATDAVEMNLQPVPGFNPEASVCPEGQTASNVFFDGLESGGANWASTGTVTRGGVAGNPQSKWFLDANFAKAGSHELIGLGYGEFQEETIVDATLAMASAVTIPANAYLRFDHAFDLETSFDGGSIEYSVAGGTWTPMPTPLDGQGYFDSPIDSRYGNPLGGKSGFSGVSHGYVSTRFSLSPLAGQSVKFRWHLGTDNSTESYGWWIDNVQIYTCQYPVPAAPVIASITRGRGNATISFSTPGGSTSFTATCSSSGYPTRTKTGNGSPLTVSGLTGDVAYSCSVTASNAAGSSSPSSAVAVTPLPAPTGNITPILMLLLD